MTQRSTTARRCELEPMDEQIKSIQPGGGFCMRVELAWGRLRRWYLKTFRRGYVGRMQSLREGEPTDCPHEVLDPRDLKYYRNVAGCGWPAEDDPFTWRDRLPFARVGLTELLLLAGGFFLVAFALLPLYWPLALVPAALGLEVVWFFRDPKRRVPLEPGLVVAPADGRVVSVEEIEYDEFIGGPAVEIGIFLSVFNVHINRVPVAARIIGMTYRPGKFLNALRPSSARENEQLAVRLEEDLPPYRRMIVRQIAGAIARRIVCWVRPGDQLQRGAQFGMIKLGSRTELVMPLDESLSIEVQPGQKVKAGSTVMARYAPIVEDAENRT